jgi:hypothetical protein
MICPTDELLRTRMDEELSTAESEGVDAHLRSCADCRARWTAMAARAGQIRSQLDALAPEREASAIDPVFAFNGYRERYGEPLQGRAKWFNRAAASWRRPLLSPLAVACAIVLMFSFAPGRSWAQKILSMLRVQKVAVVPVDLAALTAGNGNTGSGKLIAQFISDNIVVTMSPGKPSVAADPSAASAMAGFRVRTFDGLGAPQQILVSDEGAFHMTLNRDRIQALLDQVGRSDMQVPAAVDGSTVAVHIPKLVRSVYGNCPDKNSRRASSTSDGAVSDLPSENCLDFVQVKSPIVSVPPSLDVPALAQAGLQVAGMSAGEAQAFCRTVDWSSTLVIPIPQRDNSYRQIAVDGVNGTLIEDPPHGNFAGAYTLIWVKNGVVYSLGGNGSASQALSAVQSLN